MTEYTITIDGFEAGSLDRKTVEQSLREKYGAPNATITVTESGESEFVNSREVLRYLHELKQEFSPQEDAYANISMTMNYIEDTGYYNDITRPDEGDN